jgi:hypothetical protein
LESGSWVRFGVESRSIHHEDREDTKFGNNPGAATDPEILRGRVPLLRRLHGLGASRPTRLHRLETGGTLVQL